MIARTAWAAVMLAVAVCVLAGCASESIHPGAAQASAPVPTVSASPEGVPIGEALASVSAQLDSSAFATMTLGSMATTPLVSTATTATAPDTWLQATLDPAGPQDNDILRNTWEAFLAEGAIAKLAAPPGSQTPATGIAGIAVDTPEPDGTIDHAT